MRERKRQSRRPEAAAATADPLGCVGSSRCRGCDCDSSAELTRFRLYFPFLLLLSLSLSLADPHRSLFSVSCLFFFFCPHFYLNSSVCRLKKCRRPSRFLPAWLCLVSGVAMVTIEALSWLRVELILDAVHPHFTPRPPDRDYTGVGF